MFLNLFRKILICCVLSVCFFTIQPIYGADSLEANEDDVDIRRTQVDIRRAQAPSYARQLLNTGKVVVEEFRKVPDNVWHLTFLCAVIVGGWSQILYNNYTLTGDMFDFSRLDLGNTSLGYP